MAVELEDRAEVPGLDVGAGDAMPGEIEAVGVGLEPVPQRDARHGEPVACDVDESMQRVQLFFVETRNVLGDHRAEERAAERRAARGQVAVVERHASRRHVPPCVTHVQLGEQHPPSLSSSGGVTAGRRSLARTATSSPRWRRP